MRLHATGAPMARVRLAPTGTDTVTLAVADGAGRPLASVGSLTLRPVSAEQFGRGRSRVADLLHRVEWTGAVASGKAEGTWGVLGADVLGLATSEAPAEVFADLGVLGGVSRVPDVVVVGVDSGGVPGVVAGRVLELVQGWLAGEVFGASRLVVVTRGAVVGGAG